MTSNFTSTNYQANLQTTQSKSLVFIDSNIADCSSLVAGIKNGVEVILLDRNSDGVEQIAAALQKFAALYGSLDAIHIFSHGSSGQLQLGSTILSSENLEQHTPQLQQWRNAFHILPSAENTSATSATKAAATDIFLYGCDVAAAEGASFVDKLSQITGADVAASADKTGSAARGGNWDFEYITGEIEAPAVLEAEAQAAYKGVLATLTVTNNADSGAGSLRNAIAAAGAGDTIIFAPSLAGQTIALSSGELLINKNLIIDGAAAPGLTVSGNNASRVIDVTATGANLALQNLIIADGRTTGIGEPGAGAGLRTASNTTLTVQNSQFRNNNANGEGGGAIFAGFRSNNTVINSVFDGNRTSGNDGTAIRSERGGGAIAVKSESNTIVTDSTFTNNVGIIGGAINTLLGGLTVERSTFINNDATPGGAFSVAPSYTKGYGGAIYTDGASPTPDATDSGTIAIRNSRFEGNKGAGQGGGLFLFVYDTDQVIVENNTIVNNSVIQDAKGDSLGGGLRLGGKGNFTVNNTTLANNSALQQGGGLWVGGQLSLNVTNSTFSGNQAVDGSGTGGFGGGMMSGSADPVFLTNVTVAFNRAGSEGGGIKGGTNITLRNTIVANNTANNAFGIKQNAADGNGFQSNPAPYFTDGGGNLQWPAITNNFNNGDITANVLEVDPLLGPLQDNGGGIPTHALLAGSGAIDVGIATGSPATDQRGILRPQDGDSNGTALIDIGAYEFPGAVPEISVLDNTTNIADGITIALDFGSTTVGTPITKTFSIQNTGTAALSLSSLSLPAGFSVVGALPSSIAAGSQATLQVQLDAAGVGNSNGVLSFVNNDSDENPFDLAIAGTVTAIPAPEIQVLDAATDIADGTAFAIDFGSTTIGTPISKSFTVKNIGAAALSLSSLSLPAGFSVVGALPSSIAAGSQATLQVQLDAAALGNPNGVLSFTTNDSDENPFDLAIAGNVAATIAPSCLCDQFPTPNLSTTLPVANSIASTLNGTDSDDTITGGAAAEAINGAGGNDILAGMDGSDNIDGGDGNDLLYGNTGNDIILGYFGRDTIFGGQDNDALFGGSDDDIIAGNIGNDTILGGKNNDLLYGNVGDDFIDGQLGNDTIFGGQDNDALLGGVDDDIIAGDIGNDTVLGQDGNDLLYGNVGDDFIAGGIGDDTIFGGKDNDILKGGVGNDIVAGDIGNDTLCGCDGNDVLYGNVGTDIMDGCEGDDTLFGGQENDTLIGNIGSDNLNGDFGNDLVYGNAGADTLSGGDGDDSLYGGKDGDILTGGIGNDWLNGDFGNDTLTGGGGSDRFIFSAGTGSDVVTDFADGIDLLGLAGGLSFADLTVIQGASATLISIASSGELLASLNGVQATAIAADDFTLI